MTARVDRQTVDLSAYPDLVVISLGMRVRTPRGLVKFAQTGSGRVRSQPLKKPSD